MVGLNFVREFDSDGQGNDGGILTARGESQRCNGLRGREMRQLKGNVERQQVSKFNSWLSLPKNDVFSMYGCLTLYICKTFYGT